MVGSSHTSFFQQNCWKLGQLCCKTAALPNHSPGLKARISKTPDPHRSPDLKKRSRPRVRLPPVLRVFIEWIVWERNLNLGLKSSRLVGNGRGRRWMVAKTTG